MQQLQQEGIPLMPEYPSEELRASDPRLSGSGSGISSCNGQARCMGTTGKPFQQQEQAQRQQQAARLEQEAARLADWMPEFRDPAKRDALMQDITTKAKKHYSLTDEMLSITTAEEVAILRDALRYREAVARKDSAKAKVAISRQLPNHLRKSPCKLTSKNKPQARQAMRKSGSVDDIANFLLS